MTIEVGCGMNRKGKYIHRIQHGVWIFIDSHKGQSVGSAFLTLPYYTQPPHLYHGPAQPHLPFLPVYREGVNNKWVKVEPHWRESYQKGES